MYRRMFPTIPPRAAGRRASTALVITALLGGCSAPRMPGIYRIDVQQGNVITQEQLAALERGMEKNKVRFILGTPLVADAFNQNRWDYYYSLEKMGEERVQRVISVFFEDDRLVRVSGGVRAATGPIVVDTRRDELVAVPPGYRDDGLLAAITPGFLSQRAKPRAKPEPESKPESKPESDAPAQSAEAAAQPAADASPATPAVEVSAEDERYLRGLLEGFGREQRDDAAGAPAAAAAGTASDAAQAAGEQEEGFLSRWARRLGIKDEQSTSPPPAAPR